jgi:hemerythrin-like domain-containing protein
MQDWMTASKSFAENWDHLSQVLPSALRPKSELVRALVRDHDDLRALIAVLKSDKDVKTKKTAYKRFTDLLKSHSVSEEKAVYDLCLGYRELRQDTFEGWTEHEVCNDLMKRISAIRHADKWQGAVKVLAELVEHHVDEEERDLFPEMEKAVALDRRLAAEAKFLELRDDTQKQGKFAGVVTEIRQ